ncbi:hypothetical protein Pelo_6455 [Pelomyxa schiedti]|nr:hypothetical protein Pelo_6455 [Pelomyxa schiedti]
MFLLMLICSNRTQIFSPMTNLVVGVPEVTIDLNEVVVVEEKQKQNNEAAGGRPMFSLVPSEVWTECCELFESHPGHKEGEGEQQLVSVDDVKQQWRNHHNASPSQIDSISSMVQQEQNGTLMSLKGFALGCFLLSESSSSLPKLCSVKQYIDTGFRGSTALLTLCESRPKRLVSLALWAVLLIVNVILLVALVAHPESYSFGLITFVIALFWDWNCPWRNQQQTTDCALALSMWSCFNLALGYFWIVIAPPHGHTAQWLFLLWVCWRLLQGVFMVLSTAYIGNVCRVLFQLSPDYNVSVPQRSTTSSRLFILVDGLVVALFFLLLVAAVVSLASPRKFCGPLSLIVAFLLPAVGIFISLRVIGYSKRVVGAVVALLFTVVNIVIGCLWSAGHWAQT